MTAAEALPMLEALIGTQLGVGEWMVVSQERVAGFADAIGRSHEEVPAFLILSLIPGMTATIEVPGDSPRATVNYGLDRCRLLKPVRPGARIRARVILLGVEDGGGWLQVRRRIVLEDETGSELFEAETLTRWLW